MKPEKYREFLIGRIFERHDFNSTDELLAEIEKVNAMDREGEGWGKWKHAGNVLAEKAPLREDNFYNLHHSDVPAFISQELNEMRLFKQRTEKKRGPRNG